MLKTQKQAREAYADMINECDSVSSMLEKYPYWKARETPAKMMRFNDPTMYRCGFVDWIDGMVTDRQAVKNGVNWSSEV